MVELLSYPCAASLGGDQRVRWENESLDHFLILLNFVSESQLAKEPANRIRVRQNTGRIWEAVSTHAGELGFNVRCIARIARRLEKRGLILRTASLGGRRFGRSDRDGRIVVAAGVDLGPLIERASSLARLIQHQVRTSECLRDYRQRANDLIRSIRGLGVEQAPIAARDVFPRLRPSEVNDVDRLAEVNEALEVVLTDFSSDPGRTTVAAASDTSGRPDTNAEQKTKTCITKKPRTVEQLIATPEHIALLAKEELREIVEFYWIAQDQRGKLSKNSVNSASRDRALQLGVSGAIWQQNCNLPGADRTALCLVIADRNAQRTGRYQVGDTAKPVAGTARKKARQRGNVDSLLGELMAFLAGRSQ